MKPTILGVVLTVGVGMLIPAMAEGADATKGQVAYQKACTKCHGTTGKGDGPMGARLNPKLKDLSDKSYNGSLRDDYLTKIILEGGKAVGKSSVMPKLAADLKEGDVADIIAYLRSLAK